MLVQTTTTPSAAPQTRLPRTDVERALDKFIGRDDLMRVDYGAGATRPVIVGLSGAQEGYATLRQAMAHAQVEAFDAKQHDGSKITQGASFAVVQAGDRFAIGMLDSPLVWSSEIHPCLAPQTFETRRGPLGDAIKGIVDAWGEPVFHHGQYGLGW